MISDIRSFTGRAADMLNRAALSKPDHTDYTNKTYPQEMNKAHSVGKKIIRGIGRLFCSGIITGLSAPVGAIYHFSASALCGVKSVFQKAENKEKSLQEAKAHAKAFAIDGGVTALVVLASLTAVATMGLSFLAPAAVEVAYIVAPNKFTHCTWKDMNPEAPGTTQSYIGYNNRLADKVFETAPGADTVYS
ncbi:MAG: hypothetical protein ACI9S8_001901 [Chlamydiales bacterium]|jgi:hypothetical protein